MRPTCLRCVLVSSYLLFAITPLTLLQTSTIKPLTSTTRRLLIFPPVAIGVIVLVLMARSRTEPEPLAPAEIVRTLRVIKVPQVRLVPRVLGYGTARASESWKAVAEVKGRVIRVNRELKAGAVLNQGEEALRIDPAEYELRIVQLQADIAQVQAQQAEQTALENNYQLSLKIEQDSLTLAQRDLARLQQLATSNTVTQSEIEKKQREELTQQQHVQNLRSSLNVLPAQRAALAANLAAKQAALDLARLDLKHTEITAPFHCRLADVSLQEGEFLAAGQTLFEAYGTSQAEIDAQLPIDQVRNLLDPTLGSIDLTADAMATMRAIFDVEVVVRLQTGALNVEWAGRFDRVREQLDPRTRTVQIVVVVEKPYSQVIPGKQPPLAPGMFCEVELRGKPLADRIVIPRSSMRGGQVCLINAENRLQRRKVNVAMIQGDFLVIRSGLQAGEMLVLNVPTPAIEGMLVEPVLDKVAVKQLVEDAEGTNTPVK
jgi:multidrug efflux system membrane fusion protein